MLTQGVTLPHEIVSEGLPLHGSAKHILSLVLNSVALILKLALLLLRMHGPQASHCPQLPPASDSNRGPCPGRGTGLTCPGLGTLVWLSFPGKYITSDSNRGPCPGRGTGLTCPGLGTMVWLFFPCESRLLFPFPFPCPFPCVLCDH